MKRLISIIIIFALLFPCTAVLAEESFTSRTSLYSASSAQKNNIRLASRAITDLTIEYGEYFSFNDLVGARTKSRGYMEARNGRGVMITGGGVAQCATTLYLALTKSEADIVYTDFSTYGSRFTGDYADSEDAILVDYSSDIDFAFVNNGRSIHIEMWQTSSYLYCCVTLGEKPYDIPDWSFEPIFDQPTVSSRIRLKGSDSLINNILLAAGSINDTVLSHNDVFSFNDIVGPRTKQYGYESAINGRGVEVTGGGVAQVASVIWLSLKQLDCFAIVEKSTYGKRYNQSYVSSSSDAIVTDYSGKTDFSFRYTGYGSMTINTYLSDNYLHCDIYID